MKRKAMEKFYALYNNKNQEKLLTTANSEEKLKLETEYYTGGVWFSYDKKEDSNLIENEKEMKGIKFPEIAKQREYKNTDTEKKSNFKWVA
jgi:hypothetical protein